MEQDSQDNLVGGTLFYRQADINWGFLVWDWVGILVLVLSLGFSIHDF